MFTTTLYGTYLTKTIKIGTFTSPRDVHRAQKLLINDDLQANKFQSVRGFVTEQAIVDLVDNIEAGHSIMISHWSKTKEVWTRAQTLAQ